MKSKKLIIISGTPGTGKSTLTKILKKKLNYQHLDIHKYYKKISFQYNKKKQCYDIDLNKFKKLVLSLFKSNYCKNGLIVDTHIAHLLPAKNVDLAIILNCSNLKELEKRLKKRKYSISKIKENLEAEIFQICFFEALEKKHKIIVFDTSKKINIPKMLLQINKYL